jgi:hypothetical protein
MGIAFLAEGAAQYEKKITAFSTSAIYGSIGFSARCQFGFGPMAKRDPPKAQT